MQNPGTVFRIEQQVLKIPPFNLQINGIEYLLRGFLQCRHVGYSPPLHQKTEVGKCLRQQKHHIIKVTSLPAVQHRRHLHGAADGGDSGGSGGQLCV